MNAIHPNLGADPRAVARWFRTTPSPMAQTPLSRAHNPRRPAPHRRRGAGEPELVPIRRFHAFFLPPDEFREAPADPLHPFIRRAIRLRALGVQVALIVA